MKKIILLMSVLLIFASVAIASDSTDVKKKAETEMKKVEKKADSTKTAMDYSAKKVADLELKKTKSGVEYFDFVEGTGKSCDIGTKVECHYTLWLVDENGERGERFQSSKDVNPQTGKASTFVCTLGKGLITGWSEGMVGMKEGGTRLLRIPPAIGSRQLGRGFPPDKDIIFEIDFIKFIE